MRVEVAASLPAKLCGLLFAKPDGRLLVMLSCHDIHTFGMSYPIDVAFLDGTLRVIEAHRNVPPGRRLRCAGAWAVVERASAPWAGWYRPGRRAGPGLRTAVADHLMRRSSRAPSKRVAQWGNGSDGKAKGRQSIKRRK